MFFCKFQPQNFFRLLDGSIENGQIYCRVERDAISMIQGTEFNLMSKKYFLLIAAGAGLRPNTVDYHDLGRAASSEGLKTFNFHGFFLN